MKKISKIFFLILLAFFFAACNKKSNELVEITGYDIYNNYLDKRSMVIALISEEDNNYNTYIDNLEKSLHRTNSNIYYTKLNKLDTLQLQLLNDTFEIDGITPHLVVLQNGNIIIDNSNLMNVNEVIGIVSGKNYENLALNMEDKEKNYNVATEYLKDGLIGSAFYYYSLSVPYKDASSILDSDSFKLLDNWVYEELDGDDYLYLNLNFSKENSTFQRVYYQGKFQDFNKDEIPFTEYSYQIRDNIIYVKSGKNKEKKMYTIKDLKEELSIFTSKKEYVMKRG